MPDAVAERPPGPVLHRAGDLAVLTPAEVRDDTDITAVLVFGSGFGPLRRFLQRTVDRLPWIAVAVIAGVTLGALVGGLAALLGWLAGELAWLGEQRRRVLVLVAMFGLIAAVSWWEHRWKVRARRNRGAAGGGPGSDTSR